MVRRPTRTSPPTTCAHLAAEYTRIVKAKTGKRLPDRSVRAARAGGPRRLRQLVREARPRLPQVQQDPARPRHGGELVTMVFGNMGDDSRHRRRLHARPDHRRDGALRRVPDERPGRGRRRRHPHAGRDQPDAGRAAGGLPPVRGDRPAAGDALPRRPGSGVHDRARHALHAPDPLRRSAPPPAAVKIAVDMVARGSSPRRRRSSASSPARSSSCCCRASTRPQGRRPGRPSARQGPERLTGRGQGAAVFDAGPRGRAEASGAKPVILVRPETSPDDVHGMLAAQGRPHRPRRRHEPRGGRRARHGHAVRGRRRVASASTTRGARCSAGGRRRVNEGDMISIDGTTGEVFAGELPTIEPRFEDEHDLATLLGWADETRDASRCGRTPTTRATRSARATFGAQGIGLCRTEHMFFEEERLPIVRRMILAANTATAAKNRTDAERSWRIASDRHFERAGRARDAADRRLRRPVPGDGRPAGRHPPHRPAAPRVPAVARRADWSTGCDAREDGKRSTPPSSTRRPSCSTRSRRCASRTRCSACAAAAWDCCSPRSSRCRRAPSSRRRRAKHEGKRSQPEIMIPLVGHVNELRGDARASSSPRSDRRRTRDGGRTTSSAR